MVCWVSPLKEKEMTLSVKNIIVLILLVVAGWWLYKRL